MILCAIKHLLSAPLLVVLFRYTSIPFLPNKSDYLANTGTVFVYFAAIKHRLSVLLKVVPLEYACTFRWYFSGTDVGYIG